MRSIDVTERVLNVIAEVAKRQPREILPSASLRNDLHMDSLQRMTLFIVLEDEFQRTIPLEEVTKLDSVREIIDLITQRLQNTPGS